MEGKSDSISSHVCASYHILGVPNNVCPIQGRRKHLKFGGGGGIFHNFRNYGPDIYSTSGIMALKSPGGGGT